MRFNRNSFCAPSKNQLSFKLTIQLVYLTHQHLNLIKRYFNEKSVSKHSDDNVSLCVNNRKGGGAVDVPRHTHNGTCGLVENRKHMCRINSVI